MYEQGHGTPPDLTEAFRWYKEAAVQEDGDAQYHMFLCLKGGLGTAKDMRAAYSWLLKAANQNQTDAMYEIGSLYYDQGKYAEAVKYLEKPASQGYAEAQFRMGWCYHNGKGVQQDLKKAVAYYKQAVVQGHALAKNNLGVCYDNEWGVAHDPHMAFKLFKEAAEQGLVLGQVNVASRYETGAGTARNVEEAIQWYTKAADQVNANAKAALARLKKQSQEAEKRKFTGLSPYQAKDKFKLALICFFLGCLGIHNFMMVETKRGIAKLLISYTGVSIILAIVDFVKIVRGTYKVDPNTFW